MKIVYNIIFVSVLLTFLACGIKDSLDDDILYKKIIITSNYKIEWYSKSGITRIYPNYIKIIDEKNKTMALLEEEEIDDINMLVGDTLIITYGRHYNIEFLNKKDTIIKNLFVKYKNSSLDYNSTIKYGNFEGY